MTINGYEVMINQVRMTEAEEESAQANLQGKYENNYPNAPTPLGKIRAERLFPKLSNSGRMSQTVEDEKSSKEVV